MLNLYFFDTDKDSEDKSYVMKENLIKGKLKDFIKTYESCYSSTWLGLKYTINKLTSLVIQK